MSSHLLCIIYEVLGTANPLASSFCPWFSQDSAPSQPWTLLRSNKLFRSKMELLLRRKIFGLWVCGWRLGFMSVLKRWRLTPKPVFKTIQFLSQKSRMIIQKLLSNCYNCNFRLSKERVQKSIKFLFFQ